ncbi:MAG: DEAD/DEAH box helicase, partial [Syntrophomonas sp.]
VKVQVISGLHEVVDDFNNEPKDVYIVNYDIFSNYLEELSDVLPRAIIFDESHYLKNSKSNRGKAAMKLVETTAAPIVLMLTGTPVLNRPRELWQQLKIMGRAAEFGSEWKFLKHYCQGESGGFGQDYDGAQNLEELNKRMRATCFIRRLKCNVMKELPAKQRSNVVVQIDNRSEYNRVLNDFWGWMESQGKGETSNNAEKLTQIEYLKQAAARGKLSAIKRWIRDFMESGEKLVVFAHHKEIQKSILAEFPTAAHIFGEDTMAARQVNVDRFQTDPTCQLMVASVKAAGVGLTLTAASNVVFCELGWTPAEHDQAEDRTHRIGQTESVNIYYMIATDTIDEDIMELLLEKKRVVGEATDGVYVGEEVPVQILSEVMKRLKVQWAERGKVSHINQELVLDLDEEEIVSNTKLVHDFEDLFKKQNTTNQDEARVQDKIGELNYKLDFSLDFPNSSMSEESLDQIFGKGPGNLDDPDSLYKDISI